MYDLEQRIIRKAFQRYVSVSVTALMIETNQSSQTCQTMSMPTVGSDSRQIRYFKACTPPATPVACVAAKGSECIDLDLLILNLLILINEFQAKAEIRGQSSKASAIYFSNYRGAPLAAFTLGKYNGQPIQIRNMQASLAQRFRSLSFRCAAAT
jgi:hypothetical protein